MKKNIFLTGFLLLFISTNAQKLSYGLILGEQFYEVANNNGSSDFNPANKQFTPNFGGYLEYGFTEKLGIKTEMTLNNKVLKYSITKSEVKFSFFEICPSFKYDFGKEYRKGLYMLIGSKFSFITKATSDGENSKEAFNATNVGAQLGFGYRVFKFIDLQTKLDYEITPFFQLSGVNRKSNLFGAYFSLNIDMEKIINQK